MLMLNALLLAQAVSPDPVWWDRLLSQMPLFGAALAVLVLLRKGELQWRRDVDQLIKVVTDNANQRLADAAER